MSVCTKCKRQLPYGCICSTTTFKDVVGKTFWALQIAQSRGTSDDPVACALLITKRIESLEHQHGDEVQRLERQFLNEAAAHDKTRQDLAAAHDKTRQDLAAKDRELRRIQENFYKDRIDAVLEKSKQTEEDNGSPE